MRATEEELKLLRERFDILDCGNEAWRGHVCDFHRGWLDGHDEQSEPLLGLATTEELLNEVAVRMEVTQNSTNGRKLGALCREALDKLDRGVLAYRTHGGEA